MFKKCGGVNLNKKMMTLMLIIVAVLLMYVGSTMFYNTGIGITDLKVVETSDSGEYNATYMLRSVRSFEKLECEHTLLTKENKELASNKTELDNIKDGTFNIDQAIKVNDNTQKASKIKIKIKDMTSQKTMFEQTSDI